MKKKGKKFFLINTYLLKWDIIHYLYNSFLGKMLMLLGILSIILTFEINSSSLRFLSASVLIFIIGYIVYIIFIPTIIRDFTKYDYIQYMLDREREKHLSKVTEFSFLQNKNLEELPIFLDEIDNFMPIKTVEDFIAKDSIYQLSQIKFDYLNNIHIYARMIVTVLLILFFIVFYYLSISKIISYVLQ